MTKESLKINNLYSFLDFNSLSYFYRGNFNQSITDAILALTETNLSSINEPIKTRKRVYTILVEGLQNITRHQEEIEEKEGFFGVEQCDNAYKITTSNIIASDKIDKLSSQIDTINSLDKDELKSYYKKTLMENELSSKGGAGLGLIEMARKSGNKLHYRFKKIDDEKSYFYLRSDIHQLSNIESFKGQQFSFDDILSLHEYLIKENVLIIFNGAFNQESLINLLSIIETQMEEQVSIRKKVFNIMVELLQNIVKHGVSKSNASGNPGIFFISNTDNRYELNTGNFVKSEYVNRIKQNIDYINSLSFEELNNFYDDRLFNFQIDSNKESGLGFIELRLKSGNKLSYNFTQIDSELSFFTIKVSIA